jgi:hypothetical protein
MNKYGDYNSIYKPTLDKLEPIEKKNELFLKSKGIQSNWQYRKYLTNKVIINNEIDSFENNNKLYYKLEDKNRHNKSDLKVNYVNTLKNGFYKIAPSLHTN